MLPCNVPKTNSITAAVKYHGNQNGNCPRTSIIIIGNDALRLTAPVGAAKEFIGDGTSKKTQHHYRYREEYDASAAHPVDDEKCNESADKISDGNR